MLEALHCPVRRQIQMHADVSAMNHWRAPGPGNYVFADAAPLVERISAEIV